MRAVSAINPAPASAVQPAAPSGPALSTAVFRAMLAPAAASDGDAPPSPSRQDDAASGKDVPAPVPPSIDPATIPQPTIDLSWIGAALPPPSPSPSPPPPPSPSPSQSPSPSLSLSPPPSLALPLPAPLPVTVPVPPIPAAPATDPVPQAAAVIPVLPQAALAPPAKAAPAAPDRPRTAAPGAVVRLGDQSFVTAPRAVNDLILSTGRPETAPAAQIFAEAIRRALADDQPAAAAPDAPAVGALAPAGQAVAALADSRQPALDLRQEDWPQQMIRRIETLRDAANANDATIRLVPDALGKIDVSLRRDGDTVNVQFSTQHAETRQILADAQPRLTELAEARGLKLAATTATTTGDMTGHGTPHHRAAPTFRQSPGPVSTGDDTATDDRIA